MASDLITSILGRKFRSVQVDNLLYLTNGYSIPKMFDGTDIVNWGITRPSTAPTAAESSTGLNDVDLCESLWTPAFTTIEDCEDAWSLDSAWDGSALASVSSAYVKTGSTSASFLLGVAIEPLSANSVLMLHGNGTDGSTTIVDSSAQSNTMTCHGSAQLLVADKKFGTASMHFTGSTADWISAPDSAAWDWGTDDYTVEAWVNFTTLPTAVFYSYLFGTQAAPGLGTGMAVDMVYSGGNRVIRVWHNTTAVRSQAVSVSAGIWYHLRVVRSSGQVYIFWDGNEQGSDASGTQNISGGTAGANIGGGASAPVNCYFDGYIDELRFEKGVALSIVDFVVPTEEYGEFATLLYDPLNVTGLIATENIGPLDLSTYWGVEFWIRSAKETSIGDLELVLYDTAAGVDELGRFGCPALTPDTWTKVTAKFNTPADLSSVASIGLWLNTDLGMNAVYLDDIKAIRCKVSLDEDERTQGAKSIKIEVPGNIPDNTLLAYLDHAAIDMSGDTHIYFDIKADKDIGYQSLKFLLDNTSACASPIDSLYVDANLAADTWHPVGLALGTPSAGIVSHGLTLAKQSQAPCTIWIDNIRRGSGTAGNLSGRYYTWVSFYSSKYDRESDLSPISNVVEVEGQAINLSSIPVSTDTQVDMRRIYRSAAGGTVPYLDQTIEDNTTTTASCTKTDAGLLASSKHPSEEAGSGKFEPPQAFKYLAIKDNRIIGVGAEVYSRGTVNVTNASATFTFNDADLDDSFVGSKIRILGDQEEYLIESVNTGAGTAVARPIDDLESGTYKGTTRNNLIYQIYGDENTIYTSYIDDNNVPRPHGFPIDLAQRVEGGSSNDKLTGVSIIGSGILLTKRGSTFLAEGSYPPYTIGDPISDKLGCISHDTIQSDLSGRAFWLAGKSGIVMSDGFNVSNISTNLRQIFNGSHALGLNTSLYEKTHAVLDIENDVYYLFCASKDSSINNVVIVLDMGDGDPKTWKFYYFTGIEAASSTIVYDENNNPTIYIGDYDGFMYRLNVDYYDGIKLGTLSGNPTSVSGTTITDSGAAFYLNGSGLTGIPVVVENPSTGSINVYKIESNTGTTFTIEGEWEETPTTSFNYYIGGYELAWKSKAGYPERATDKAYMFDAALNFEALTSTKYLRVKLNQGLDHSNFIDAVHDLSDSSEEVIMLVATRLAQVQWDLTSVGHEEEAKIHALGLRFDKQGLV